jgi:hypothetical protein
VLSAETNPGVSPTCTTETATISDRVRATKLRVFKFMVAPSKVELGSSGCVFNRFRVPHIYIYLSSTCSAYKLSYRLRTNDLGDVGLL